MGASFLSPTPVLPLYTSLRSSITTPTSGVAAEARKAQDAQPSGLERASASRWCTRGTAIICPIAEEGLALGEGFRPCHLLVEDAIPNLHLAMLELGPGVGHVTGGHPLVLTGWSHVPGVPPFLFLWHLSPRACTARPGVAGALSPGECGGVVLAIFPFLASKRLCLLTAVQIFGMLIA